MILVLLEKTINYQSGIMINWWLREVCRTYYPHEQDKNSITIGYDGVINCYLREDNPGAKDKSEMARQIKEPVGAHRFYDFSTRIEDFKDTRMIIAQWHQKAGVPPRLSLIVDNDTISIFLALGKDQGKTLWAGQASTEWDDWVFDIRWHWLDDAFINVTRNGKSILKYKGQTMLKEFLDFAAYFVFGIYSPGGKLAKPGWKERTILYKNINIRHK